MVFTLYNLYDENKKKVDYQSNGSTLVLNKKENKSLSSIAKQIKNQDLYFAIDEKEYKSEDVSIILVNVIDVAKIYFVFPRFESVETKDLIFKELTLLKEMPVATKEDKDNKILRVFEMLSKHHPLFGFTDKYLSVVNLELTDKYGFVFIMKNNPEDVKEKDFKEKNDRKWNAGISLFSQAILVCLFYFSYHSFNNNQTVLAVILLIIAIVESLLFNFIIVSAIVDKKITHYLKTNWIVPVGALGGLLVGFGLSYILGKFLLAVKDEKLMLSLIFYGLLTGLFTTLLFGTLARLMSTHYMKYHQDEPTFKKCVKFLFYKGQKKKVETSDDDYYHITLD